MIRIGAIRSVSNQCSKCINTAQTIASNMTAVRTNCHAPKSFIFPSRNHVVYRLLDVVLGLGIECTGRKREISKAQILSERI